MPDLLNHHLYSKAISLNFTLQQECKNRNKANMLLLSYKKHIHSKSMATPHQSIVYQIG